MSKAIEADDQQRKGSLTSAHSDASAVDKARRKTAAKDCCKKAIKFLFSHIGLCGMVVAYSVAGGFIFQHLEQTNEKTECEKSMEKYIEMENSTNYKLWEVAKAYSSDVDDIESEENALGEYKEILEKFRTDVIDLGYGGQNCTIMGQDGGPAYEWSFAGALLFSVTVITTIGYGNIAPKTVWGRVVCIAYATLGIPLMLLCLANLGDVMADIFRFVYSKICCCGCCRRKHKTSMEEIKPESAGNITPEAWKANYKGGEKSEVPPVVYDDYDDDDDDDDDKISVPLTVTLGVIAFYIFMGALLFGMWEGWSATDASYFCFVTVSTIGFGDMVPGSADFESAEDQYKMILAAIYMLFGLALLSMCFSLIQEEIATKFRWVGEKLGLVEPDDIDDD